AFEPVVFSQGSPEFVDKFGQLIARRGIIGCYLQTELGHGTNVAQLETTATYLVNTGEFEIHSPTPTSTKWWIGALGKTATHGVVQARLILPGGEDVGPHLFFVQLRSLDDHSVLPGIQIEPSLLGLLNNLRRTVQSDSANTATLFHNIVDQSEVIVDRVWGCCCG
ncbi:acyl-CoA dehydrogenase/oxidase, partial [Phellopilus nigrolimitatus]